MTARTRLTLTASLTPRTLTSASSATMPRRERDVARRLLEAVPREAPGVVGREERRDGDRDDVVEHLRPGREERPQLVERAPREQRRAARLGVHRGRLGVRRGGAVEQRAGDEEDERRQAGGERGDEPERVVDRRADVAVGGREQRVDPEHALQSVELALCHPRRESTPSAVQAPGGARGAPAAIAVRTHWRGSRGRSRARPGRAGRPRRSLIAPWRSTAAPLDALRVLAQLLRDALGARARSCRSRCSRRRAGR